MGETLFRKEEEEESKGIPWIRWRRITARDEGGPEVFGGTGQLVLMEMEGGKCAVSKSGEIHGFIASNNGARGPLVEGVQAGRCSTTEERSALRNRSRNSVGLCRT